MAEAENNGEERGNTVVPAHDVDHTDRGSTQQSKGTTWQAINGGLLRENNSDTLRGPLDDGSSNTMSPKAANISNLEKPGSDSERVDSENEQPVMQRQ